LLNASVGVQRAIGRMRRPPSSRVSSATTVAVSLAAVLHPHSLREVVAGYRVAPKDDRKGSGIADGPPPRRARVSLIARIGHERTVALVAAAILLGASVVSVSASRPAPATGGPTGPGSDVRLAVGGDGGVDGGGTITEAEPAPGVLSLSKVSAFDDSAPGSQLESTPGTGTEVQPLQGAVVEPVEPDVEGPYLDDGTLLKPVAVDTTVADGRDLMEKYRVRDGDTLTGIASKFGVSMMTVWWANNLKSKDDLHLGQILTIPPVTGLVLTVTASDTLAGLAARYEVDEQEILDANKLDDPNLVVGQVLALPGAIGDAIVTPMVEPNTSSSSSSGGQGGSSRVPANYRGGAFSWPVSGGGNYISQYFHYGHYGLDIAGDYGSSVRAAASGRVIFAGWKGNGGGYQVWVADGSGIYTTYNHMSAISVGSGQSVSEGQQIGRVGQSGNATGPHLHFEVWRGGVWDGGTRLNPLAYF
jgi:murein DD-endopeptidase MepM/ murein hydrolase activator NlpD